MTSKDIRQKYLDFFKEKGHAVIPSAPLVPENDPTTLFTSSGMQPLIPYLLGQPHPEGKRLVDSQPSFRAQDIEEVGDNRHTTFFEMLGNWSLGDYFKKEQLPWFWEFLTQELGLDKDKLYVSVFEGDASVPKDTQSAEIWKSLGVAEDHIYYYGFKKNWWSRSGTPEKMPVGEIGGPDSEVFYEFTQVEHDPKFGEKCHPNCDCGKFLEIGNSVFIQYQKQEDDSLKELPQKNVDFGGGLERLTAATLNEPDIFKIDLFLPIIQTIETISGATYAEHAVELRVIADHMKAATFLIQNGVTPSNKLQGYILRRLLRRSAVKFYQLTKDMQFLLEMDKVYETILSLYRGLYGIDKDNQKNYQIIGDEMNKFAKTLSKGFHEIDKMTRIDGKKAFDLYQTFGFPYEITEELFRQKGQEIDEEQFKAEFEKHKELSRTASAGMFKGGLQDQSEITTKYHTATHLLHAALREVLGTHVQQKGSNITSERLRFDFPHPEKLTEEQLKKVEDLVNKKISEGLEVSSEVLDKDKAMASGALGFFGAKYGDRVTVYSIGNPSTPLRQAQGRSGSLFSREICGGPHVKNTKEIGNFKITKEESAGSGIRRIYAVVS